MVPLVDGAGVQAGEVGAGARFGIALAPDLVAAEDLRQVALLLRLGAPMNEGRAQEAHADRAGQDGGAGGEILLVENALLHEAGAAAAIFLRPGQPDPAGGMHLLLPGATLFERLAIRGDALVLRVLDLQILRQIGVEPGAELSAERGVCGRIGEVHGGSSLLARRYRAARLGALPHSGPTQADPRCVRTRSRRAADRSAAADAARR